MTEQHVAGKFVQRDAVREAWAGRRGFSSAMFCSLDGD
jgi:hypothetical protein